MTIGQSQALSLTSLTGLFKDKMGDKNYVNHFRQDINGV